MERYPWELRDPGAAVEAIARQHVLRPGQVVVGLFELPSSIQRLLDTALVFEGDHAPTDVRDCAWLIDQAAHQVFGPRLVVGEPRHAFVTVVVRHGSLEILDDDRRWLLGWQHADHRLPAYTGELFVFTEQGWRSPAHPLRGHHPVFAA